MARSHQISGIFSTFAFSENANTLNVKGVNKKCQWTIYLGDYDTLLAHKKLKTTFNQSN